ncbi:MAG TPA: hypothetical protein PKY30_15315, partial [Myxococcota bacterium]|nr:hypothetical protein [Myxococcota bacterium]
FGLKIPVAHGPARVPTEKPARFPVAQCHRRSSARVRRLPAGPMFIRFSALPVLTPTLLPTGSD